MHRAFKDGSKASQMAGSYVVQLSINTSAGKVFPVFRSMRNDTRSIGIYAALAVITIPVVLVANGSLGARFFAALRIRRCALNSAFSWLSSNPRSRSMGFLSCLSGSQVTSGISPGLMANASHCGRASRSAAARSCQKPWTVAWNVEAAWVAFFSWMSAWSELVALLYWRGRKKRKAMKRKTGKMRRRGLADRTRGVFKSIMRRVSYPCHREIRSIREKVEVCRRSVNSDVNSYRLYTYVP